MNNANINNTNKLGHTPIPYAHEIVSLLTLLFVMFHTSASSQTWNMADGQTITINGSTYPTGIIYDNGGPNNQYTNNFNGTVIIQAPAGSIINLSGFYVTESASYDWIYVYDGTTTTGTVLVDHVGGNGTIDVNAYSGSMTITFRSDYSIVRSGFELTYTVYSCNNRPTSINVDNITTTSADIYWSAANPSGPFMLTLGGQTYTVDTNHFYANGLTEATVYNVTIASTSDAQTPLCALSHSFRTLCNNSTTFIYDNLYANNVTCRYGSFSSPDQNTGVVNNGSESSSSRHTVHDIPGETDPRTGGLLQTIPDGFCSSVRLGNWSTGSQAESITYSYTVDTNDYDLLILKYAAVLEDPNHNSSQQPRFTFDITDIYGVPVNVCYSANFISNTNLGWNYGTSSNVLWKDWTTVGVDLSPLHGQTILIKLTTYDCNQGGHYGYAYFVINCGNKTLRSSSCQTVENTFFAPLGFTYSWYKSTQPNNILSNTDSLHVYDEGNYVCQLAFVGAPNDEAHRNCYFLMTAITGIRFPYSRFTPMQLDTNACNLAWVRMQNKSIITRDSAHTDSIGNGCESYLWIFDDGTSSTDINPRHGFTPGLHSATLYAMIANGVCVDSSSQTFMVHTPCTHIDTIYQMICGNNGYNLFDTTLTTEGEHTVDSLAPDGTLWIRTVYLTIHQNSSSDTIASACNTFTWHGQTSTVDTTLIRTIANTAGCDSVITLHLTINHSDRFDTTALVCDSMVWHDSTYSVSTPGHTINYNNIHGCDSTLTLHLTVVYSTSFDTTAIACDSYSWGDTIFTDSQSDYTTTTINNQGCDSITTLHLTVNYSTESDTFATVCDSYTWYGTTYTSSFTPQHVTVNTSNCDSTITLHLTINLSTDTSISDTVVENMLPYSFNGLIYNDSISHSTVTILNTAACDSIIDYSLLVYWNVDTTLYDTLCNNALPLTWNGVLFDTNILNMTSVTLADTVTFSNRYGADSTIYMYLTVHPLYDHHLHTEICDNGQLQFGDSLFVPNMSLTHNMATDSIFYLDSLHSQYGCDSLSSLHLTVHPTFDHHLYDTVCSNHSYIWGTPQRQMLPIDSVVVSTHASDTTLEYLQLPTTHYQLATYTDTVFTDYLSSINICDSISSLHLYLLPSYDLHFLDTMCDAHITSFNTDSSANWQHHIYPFIDAAYDTTGVYPHRLHTMSCDSIRTLHLKVFPTYDLHFHDTIYDGDTYTFESTTYDTTNAYPHIISAIYACDSLRTLNLQRWPRTYIDTVICQNQLPFTWNSITFTNEQGMHTSGGMQVIKDSVYLQWSLGGDSLVVMTLIVRDTAATIDVIHSCDSLLWSHTIDTIYRTTTAEPLRYLTQLSPFDTLGLAQNFRGGRYELFTKHTAPFSIQCDSVRHLNLTIDNTHYTTDFVIACDSILWPTASTSQTSQRWFFRDTVGLAGILGSHIVNGPVDTMVTAGGCDSVVQLNLAVHYSTYGCSIDTFCWHQTYTWRGQTSGDTATGISTNQYYLTDTLPTHPFIHSSQPMLSIQCDSVLAIQLTQMARPILKLHDSIHCADKFYTISLQTDMPYSRWTWDNETRINEPVTQVAPSSATTYQATVDYHASELCPLTQSITLNPIVIPHAKLKVNPEALQYDALSFDAYDITDEKPYNIHPEDFLQWKRNWYINWQMQNEFGWHLYHEAVPDRDTLTLAVSLFNGQCSDTAIQLIPIIRIAIFAPNAFTPTRDNNNKFNIKAQGILDGELFIYDRDGTLVYHASDYTDGWEGRNLNGNLCQQANYVWKLSYRTLAYPNRKQVEIGSILLIR